MLGLLAIIRAELQLLFRDIPGLMILFVMPMLLVLILTMLHSSQDSNSTELPVLVINRDHGKVGREFIDDLKDNESFVITDISKDKNFSVLKAKQDVIDGKYQGLIVVPKGVTDSVEDYTKWLIKRTGAKPKLPTLEIYLDPTVTASMKDSIDTSMQKFDDELQIKGLQNALKSFTRASKLDKDQPVLKVETDYASVGDPRFTPTAVQQSVPAWTLFGMYLILIPIAGIYVKERDQGIIQRFYVVPTHKIVFLVGRMITFVFVNMVQLVLMFALGVYVLPLLGMPALEVSGVIWQLAIIGFCIALSATSFGILLGTWARTFEQAMALGPTLIVIAAAVGGIMAPSYLLPDQLRMFSAFAPLAWGMDAFLNVLVRHAEFKTILPDLYKLLIFSAVCIVLSMLRYMRKL